MPSLSDRIDHLTATAKAIRASATAIVPSEDNPTPSAIPFTRAVLDTALGDLIRDIDASELGLFTLIPAPDADVRKQADNGTRRGEISRVEFPGATPLRKQPARRDDLFRPKEYDPEVYAHAALKYLDRYQAIRRMPRARAQVLSLIDQLDQVRDNVKKLNSTLQELTSSAAMSALTSHGSGVAEEERRIIDLQNRLSELRTQKETLLKPDSPKATTKPKAASKPIAKPPPKLSPEPENHEDAFWSTPVASARTLRFTDRLLEEEPDFNEVSVLSFDSPGPAPKSVFARLAAGDSLTEKGFSAMKDDDVFGGNESQVQSQVQEATEEDADDGDPHDNSSPTEPDPELEYDPAPSVVEAPGDEAPEEEPDEEKTVMLLKLPLPTPEDPSESSPAKATSQLATHLAEASTAPSSKASKLRVTPELERIAARIWNTVGEILVPGNSNTNPPRAKETLALIESLATRSPSPGSPTSSSVSSLTSATAGPTSHQVNTAQLLHVLLTAPNQAMPLNQLKAAIGSTRALYACVAKKLIRIDRGGGEQVVLFDA